MFLRGLQAARPWLILGVQGPRGSGGSIHREGRCTKLLTGRGRFEKEARTAHPGERGPSGPWRCTEGPC